MYNKYIYILESISSLTPQFVTHFWSALKGEYMMYFSLEFVFKREIMSDQKGDGSAMGARRMHPAKMGHVLFFSLEQERKREAGASIRHSLLNSSLISEVHIDRV